jgi:hypothetical protein
MKILQAIDRLKEGSGRRGWNVKFFNQKAFMDLIETIEEEGFVIREQGASIDRFVNQEFEFRLRHLLLVNKVPSGSDIVIGERVFEKNSGKNLSKIIFNILTEKGDMLDLEFINSKQTSFPKTSNLDIYLTAFHEAGHEILREVFLGDVTEPELISIIPGVTRINERWILYSGIAKKRYTLNYRDTKSAIISVLAGFLGGEVAESLVSIGGVTSSGKSNDTERATQIIKRAILSSGLSENWGIESLPEYSNVNEIINTFSDSKKKLFEKEVRLWLKESREIAKKYLLLNFESVLVPLAKQLAQKGTLEEKEIKGFYANHSLVTPDSSYFKRNSLAPAWLKTKSKVVSSLTPKSRDPKLFPWIKEPEDVMTSKKYVKQIRDEEISKVQISKKIPVERKFKKCKTIFEAQSLKR